VELEWRGLNYPATPSAGLEKTLIGKPVEYKVSVAFITYNQLSW